MKSYYIGIDNGSTGTIGIIGPGKTLFFKTPIKMEQDYTKKKQNIGRLDHEKLLNIIISEVDIRDCIVVFERPSVNPGNVKGSVASGRVFESQLVIIERLQLPYRVIPSTTWQKAILPPGIKGRELLKKASREIACMWYPEHAAFIQKAKDRDGDGILIAEWARKEGL